jgi:hypothetical protein
VDAKPWSPHEPSAESLPPHLREGRPQGERAAFESPPFERKKGEWAGKPPGFKKPFKKKPGGKPNDGPKKPFKAKRPG